jgi:hypothetical protein
MGKKISNASTDYGHGKHVVSKGDHIITSGTSPTGTILSFAVILSSFQVPVMQ